MASQSPSSTEALAKGLAASPTYLAGWAALTQLMEQGHSWSGLERTCVFLNLGGEQFVDSSAISGLDFEDDGRACVPCDLDGDGDLDLVFKNRTGPQLRFLRNDLGTGTSLRIRLADATGNRDAIGARVELLAGARRLVRTVTCGDGYLGQASRWLHFGLRGVPQVERIEVRWPDGATESFNPPDRPGRHVAVRGSGRLEPVAEAVRAPAADPTPLAALSSAGAVVLREPLPLPPTLSSIAFRGNQRERPVLLACWAQSCEPCAHEIVDFAAAHRALQETGIDIVLLGLDAGADQAKAALRFQELIAAHAGAEAAMRHRPASAAAQRAFAVLLTALLGLDPPPLPVSLLIDTNGCIQIVFIGGVKAAALQADAARFGRAQVAGPLRSQRPGRWAFEVQRPLLPLAKSFAQHELPLDASFYERLAAQRRAGEGRK